MTLGAERLSLAEGGVLWGMGPTAEQCWAYLVEHGPWSDQLVRQRMAIAWTHKEILRLLSLRMLTSAVAGEDTSAFASIRKCLADEFGQEIMGLLKDLRGAHAMLGTQNRTSEHDDVHHWGYLFGRALTIGGGTSEVQRNIIGERLLGLPRELSAAVRFVISGREVPGDDAVGPTASSARHLPRPARLASYSAPSARLRTSSGFSLPSLIATPMLTPSVTSMSPTMMGSATEAMMRSATDAGLDRMMQAFEHDDELVAAEPADAVGRPDTPCGSDGRRSRGPRRRSGGRGCR